MAMAEYYREVAAMLLEVIEERRKDLSEIFKETSPDDTARVEKLSQCVDLCRTAFRGLKYLQAQSNTVTTDEAQDAIDGALFIIGKVSNCLNEQEGT